MAGSGGTQAPGPGASATREATPAIQHGEPAGKDETSRAGDNDEAGHSEPATTQSGASESAASGSGTGDNGAGSEPSGEPEATKESPEATKEPEATTKEPEATKESPEAAGDAAGLAPDDEVTLAQGIARYHRRGCILIRFLSDDDLETMTRSAAEAAKCVPCRACQPDKPTPPADPKAS